MVNKNIVFFILMLLTLCGAFCSCEPVNNGSCKLYIHYFTVPTCFSDNSSTEDAVRDLKSYLVQTAGGYSELGTAEGGWMDQQGYSQKEGIVSFLVSSSMNLSGDLKKYLAEHFDQQSPYVVVWKALSD